MALAESTTAASLAEGDHFSCSLSTALLATLRQFGGEEAVERALRDSGCPKSVTYLEETGNWLSLEQAMALLDAGQAITGDQHFARHLGERAIPSVPGSAVAEMLRALGAPEEAYRRISAASAKMNLVTTSEAREVRDGYAEIIVTARPGFPRAHQHCEWTRGLLTQPPLVFGLPPGVVEHDECAVAGAPHCRYQVSWQTAEVRAEEDLASQVVSLKAQLTSVTARLESLFATAADLVTSEKLALTLTRITERASREMRTPRCLLAVRPTPDGDPQCHHLGLDEDEAREIAGRVLSDDASTLPSSWLAAPVVSMHRDYGRLVAIYESEDRFFPQERRLLEAYARYAATALDGAIALAEARRGNAETRALLDFARSLAGASSMEVARRLADAVPRLVDCDRVAVSLRDAATERLTCVATYGYPPELDKKVRGLWVVRGETDPELGRELFNQDEPRPLFFGGDTTSPFVKEMFQTFGSVALVLVPIIVRGCVLGSMSVAVSSKPARLRESRELHDRLSGIAAQAAVGLENGELIDRMSYQARHDALTGLANRSFFSEQFAKTLESARESDTPVGLFYLDLDDFKLVNDKYGHAAGDELLCQVAARLLATLRAHDTVARLGGDEFAIIFHDAASAAGVEAARLRLASAFEEPFHIAGCDIAVRASIGRAIWPYDATELNRLLRHADTSMYSAKRAGT